jgi:tetratricopeptide (TPR) repeat protein
VAESLTAHHPANLEAYSRQIAAHFEMAQMPEPAITHYLLAAKAAQHLYANAEAISTIRRGLQLLTASPNTADREWQLNMMAKLQESLGDLLHFTAHYEEARQAYDTAQTAVTLMAVPDVVLLCRLQRKAGSSHLPQHQYEQALHLFDQAKQSLGTEPTEPHDVWWREWIDLQQERKLLFYWLNQWPKIAVILEETRPILARYGTPAQRAFFFDPSMFYRRDRFAVSDEVMNHTREWFAANMALNDPARKGSLQFMLGFSLLWHGDFAEAEATIQTALTMADQTGDLNLRARCLTYLTTTYRKQGRVAQVRDHIAPSMAAAEAAEMPEYVATAQANLAWVNWCDGDEQEALKNGRSALTLWQTLPAGHASGAFQWIALFPLIAVALSQHNLAEAIAYVQAVLDPAQQKLADELTAVLQNALITWQENQPDQTTEYLNRAITLAQQFHYL